LLILVIVVIIQELVTNVAVVRHSRQTKVQWAQVIFDGSMPGLSGPANPMSPVSRRAKNARLENPVMNLPEVSAAEMTKKSKVDG